MNNDNNDDPHYYQTLALRAGNLEEAAKWEAQLRHNEKQMLHKKSQDQIVYSLDGGKRLLAH